MQSEKEEVKISLFEEDMIVYISDAKNSTREFLNLINSFSEVAGYKINSSLPVHSSTRVPCLRSLRTPARNHTGFPTGS